MLQASINKTETLLIRNRVNLLSYLFNLVFGKYLVETYCFSFAPEEDRVLVFFTDPAFAFAVLLMINSIHI